MNYAILSSLDTILHKIQADAATIGLTIASLVIVYSAVRVMLTDETNMALYTKRWDGLRRAFLGAALIASAGAIVTFGKDLGGFLHTAQVLAPLL